VDRAAPRPRGLGEEGAGALAAREEHRAARAAAARRARLATLAALARGTAGVVAAVYLFTLGLKLLSASAAGVASLFLALSIRGVTDLAGFGWLAAYGALSGSPVAALALSLLDGGAIEAREALGMLAGSRMGASMVVLLVGMLAYLRGRGRPDGIYVGVVALVTTALTYAPATVLALWLLDTGWLDAPARAIPTGWADLPAALVAPVARPLSDALPGALLFLAGVAALLGAFAVFDRVLPRLDPPSERFERLSKRLASPRAMFLFGALVTSITMSVSLSVTILVPLTLKHVVRRQSVIPYVMGANITTFLDTLFASLLLDAGAATPVVLAEMLAVTVVSAAILLLLWRPFSGAVLWTAGHAVASRRSLAVFVAVCLALPAVLFAL
jgi:sodium-dependent phosphate cotransporter